MAGSIAGAFLSGSKPKIPEYPLLDIEREQGLAIGGNIRNLTRIERLATLVNEFSIGELQKNLEKLFPGYGQMLAKGANVIDQQLSGEIPDDVARQIQRHAAEKSISGGYGGSEFAGNLEARDLGLTSLGITNQALGSAERWLAHARSSTPNFNFESMFISPQQRMQVRLYENAQTFSRNLMKARVDAMPEPWETALKNFFDNVEESGQAVLGAYAGMKMGGGGQSGAKLGGQLSQMGNSGGGGGASGSWAYEGSTQFQSAPPPQLNDYSGTYSEPEIQSFELQPNYFQYQDSYDGHPAWYP